MGPARGRTTHDRTLTAALAALTLGAQCAEQRSTAGRGVVLQPSGGAAPAADGRRRRALVIGNASYERFGSLANPVRDASAIYGLLLRVGFEAVLVRDADVGRMRGAVQRFVASLRAGDVAVVYYSGHGVSVGGHNYLVPVDFNAACGPELGEALERGALSVDELLTAVGAQGGTNVLLLDACRNNPCVERARSLTRNLGASRTVGEGLAPVHAPLDTVILYATEPGNTASDDYEGADGQSGNSPFAEALLRHLPERADVMELTRSVRREVRALTRNRQTPWSEESLTRGVVLAAAGEPSSGGEVTEATPLVCPEGMAPIPAGTFTMGSPDGEGEADEHPQHRVQLSAYCLDRTEVTVRAYRACVQSGACTPAPTTVEWSGVSDADRPFYSQFCNGNRSDRDEHPINCVDWTQAAAYCGWTGGRLPTEAEWEYAARGSDGRRYPWGNEAPGPRLLNACGTECRDMAVRLGRSGWSVMYQSSDGWESTAPVGSYPAGASPFGILDMAGNVWEWTADWSGAYTSDLGASVVNPTGAVDGTLRVVRGGGWSYYDPSWMRAGYRGRGAVSYHYYALGFRCARGLR